MADPQMTLGLPKPGKALIGVMVTVFVLWVYLALFMNWGGGSVLVEWLVGDTQKVLHGQIWRLVTATLVQSWSDPGHLLTTLLGLYFLAPALEDRWGPRRMLAFLFGCAAFGFVVQIVLGLLFEKVRAPIWFGGLGMVEAVAVAWALAHRNATVRLFFVLPISGTMLLVFVIGMSILNLIARHAPTEGLVTPLAAMLGGWLFCDYSPLRPLWLKLKLRRIQAETAAIQKRRRRPAGADLRVIPGGRDDPPKDKRYLN